MNLTKEQQDYLKQPLYPEERQRFLRQIQQNIHIKNNYEQQRERNFRTMINVNIYGEL